MRKLREWVGPDMRSVLILEENDVFMTDSTLVANALAAIEAEAPDRPDEVYLLSTTVKQPWHLLVLRVDDVEAADLSRPYDERAFEIRPQAFWRESLIILPHHVIWRASL